MIWQKDLPLLAGLIWWVVHDLKPSKHFCHNYYVMDEFINSCIKAISLPISKSANFPLPIATWYNDSINIWRGFRYRIRQNFKDAVFTIFYSIMNKYFPANYSLVDQQYKSKSMMLLQKFSMNNHFPFSPLKVLPCTVIRWIKYHRCWWNMYGAHLLEYTVGKSGHIFVQHPTNSPVLH